MGKKSKEREIYGDVDKLKVPEVNYTVIVYSKLPDDIPIFNEIVKKYNVNKKDIQKVSEMISGFRQQMIKIRGIFNTEEEAKEHARHVRFNKFDMFMVKLYDWELTPMPVDPYYAKDKRIDEILSIDLKHEKMKKIAFEKRKELLKEYAKKLTELDQELVNDCKAYIIAKKSGEEPEKEEMDRIECVYHDNSDIVELLNQQQRFLDYNLDGIELDPPDMSDFEQKKSINAGLKVHNMNIALVSCASQLSNQRLGKAKYNFEPFLNQYNVSEKDRETFYEKLDYITRIAFSLMGGFDKESEAEDYIKQMTEVYSDFNAYIQPLYYWKIMPPQSTKQTIYANDKINKIFDKKVIDDSIFTETDTTKE